MDDLITCPKCGYQNQYYRLKCKNCDQPLPARPELFTRPRAPSPDLCCYCGEPAIHMLPLDARMKRQTAFLFAKRVETLEYGKLYSAPYCEKHYPKAEDMRRKILGYSKTFNVACTILVITCVVLVLLLFLYSQTNSITPTWGALLPTILGGIFLGGLLLFPFEPLFREISGLFFPLFLDEVCRNDLRAHLKAQGVNPPIYMAQLGYLLGMSVNHQFSEQGRKYPLRVTVYATDARFATAAGVQCLPEQRK